MPVNDEQLLKWVRDAKNGDEYAFKQILSVLEPELKMFVWGSLTPPQASGKARYYIMGADEHDVIQEGRLAIWKAVSDYDESQGMTFKNFAINLCCKRHIITKIMHAKRKKFQFHNEARSLEEPVLTDDEGGQTLGDFIFDESVDIHEKLAVENEFDQNCRNLVARLTTLEKAVFEEYVQDESYKEIAHARGVKPKTVDNALMRIRKKGAETYSDREHADDGILNPEAS